MENALLTFAVSIVMGLLVLMSIKGYSRAMFAVLVAYAVGMAWGYHLRGDLCRALHAPAVAVPRD